MKDTKIRALQLVEYSLMKVFAQICQENELRYYILGGTLLGAIRHKGFIPWDDDVDLCMPRPDYERFLDIAPQYLQEHGRGDLTVVSIYSDASYRQGMAKITSPEKQVINCSANEKRLEDAWIDVIPLDGFPSGSIAGTVHKARLLFWKVMDATAEFDYVVDTKRKRSVIGTIGIQVLRIFCKVVRPFGDNYNKVFMHTERALKRYKYDDCEKVINLYAARGFKEIFNRADLGKGQPVRFEDADFIAPKHPHEILCAIYDKNYMTPPPADERDYHNAEIL